MALHFPLLINGQCIGYFSARRTEGDMEANSINTYLIEVWTSAPLEDSDLPEHRFTMTHRYGDGAWVLIQKALEELKDKNGT